MKKWTPEKDLLLAAVWPDQGSDCLSLFPGHTLSSLRSRAAELKLKRNGRKRAVCRPKRLASIPVTRIEFYDDEPLVRNHHDKRPSKGGFGFIEGGPVHSIWAFASAIGGSHE